MELAVSEPLLPVWHIATHARGTQTLPGTSAPNRLGFVAVQAELPGLAAPAMAIADGMNEAGLTVAAQTLHTAGYQNRSSGAAIKYSLVAPLLLGCCATVAAAADTLRSVRVVDEPALAAVLGRMHWSVIDAAGGHLVFEHIDGELRVHDNAAVGVLTNDPDFRFQLQNLDQWGTYPGEARGSPAYPFPAQSEVGAVPAAVGHGYSTRLLPGGYSPPDRFVRAFLLRQTAAHADPPRNAAAAIELATGVLNNVHIVRGTVARTNAADAFELTHWALLKLPAQRQLLYRTYGNMQWRRLNLSDFALEDPARAPGPIAMFADRLGIKDVTPPPRAA